MNRREFAGIAGAGAVGLFFPRETKGVVESGLLSHEEMAQIILKHPETVYLVGNGTLCYSRQHYAAGEVYEQTIVLHDFAGKWLPDQCRVISRNYHNSSSRIWALIVKRIHDCVVEVHSYGEPHTGEKRLLYERWFDISFSGLKGIECCRSTYNMAIPKFFGGLLTIPRHFARIGEQWKEL